MVASGSEGIQNAISGVLGTLVGVYVIRVGVAGNGQELFSLLIEESGYLEVLVAMYALYLLYKFGPTHQFTGQLLVAAGIAVAINVVKNNDTIITDLQQFGSGKITLGDLGKKLFGA